MRVLLLTLLPSLCSDLHTQSSHVHHLFERVDRSWQWCRGSLACDGAVVLYVRH